MTIKERESLFKINEQIKKLSQPPQTTNTSLTGQSPTPQEISPTVTPLPIVTRPQGQG